MKISIVINKQIDYLTFTNFFNFKVGGLDFKKSILKNHPDINNKNYKEYINLFYKDHLEEIKQKQIEMNKIIKKNNVKLEQLIFNIFGTKLTDDYKGYISIFDCNPRYLEDHIFQVFYLKNQNDTIYTIIHEVLHFVFFQYYNANAVKLKLDPSYEKNSGALWNLSEVINVILLNEKEIIEITHKTDIMHYPDLKKDMEELERVWRENNKDINKFIVSGMEHYNKLH